MKIYIDLILLMNFAFDYIILLTVSIIMKRNVKIRRLIFGSIFGSLTILVLFIEMSPLILFVFKVLLSVVIILLTFGYKDFKCFINNFVYFYTTSIILGGFMYLLKIELSTFNVGLVFYSNSLKINFVFLVIFSPIILYIYTRQAKKLKCFHSLKHKVDIYLKDGTMIDVIGYLDTGNILVEPYNNKKVVIVNDKRFDKYKNLNNYLLVPYETVNGHGLMKCIVPDFIFIEGVGIKKDIVIGMSDEKINIDGINCLINNLIVEGL